jgi:hypothetical protein
MRPTHFERVNRSKLSKTEIMSSVTFLGRFVAVCVSSFREHRGLPVRPAD